MPIASSERRACGGGYTYKVAALKTVAFGRDAPRRRSPLGEAKGEEAGG